MAPLGQLFGAAIDLFDVEDDRCVPGEFLVQPSLLHLRENRAARLVAERPFQLERLLLPGDVQKACAAAGQDVGPGLVHLVVRHHDLVIGDPFHTGLVT